MRDRLVGDVDPNGYKDGDLINAKLYLAHILPEEREHIIGCSIAILQEHPGFRITGHLTIVECNLNYGMVTYRVDRK